MSPDEWPADVKPDDSGCSSGLESPASAPQRSLPDALMLLAAAIREQNGLLGQIVAQNADILAALSEDEGEQEQPRMDLSGRRIG